MITERLVGAADGRQLKTYDTGPGAVDQLTLMWFHGSPQTGAPLTPVLGAAAERGLRVVSYARPSYGGSSPQPGRDVAGAALDVAAIADALELGPLVVIGASGGGPHVLAAAAQVPGVVAAITLAGVAPYSDDYDWYAGMQSDASLRAAAQGRAARRAFVERDEFDEASFTADDYAMLAGEWRSLGDDVGRSEQWGPDGLVDDDVAFAKPWGFDLHEVEVPVLIIQGGQDRVIPPSHAHALLRALPQAELWLRPRDGHICVLRALPLALDWALQAVSGDA